MRHYRTILAAFVTVIASLALSACTQPPPPPPAVTVNPATNTVTTPPTPNPVPANAGPLATIATQLGNLVASDDANAINLACGTPAADVVGCNFYQDISQLLAQITPAAQPVAPVGFLTLAEQLRLALIKNSTTTPNPLMAKTLADGIIWVTDTRARLIAVPTQVTALLGTIASVLIGVQIPVLP